MSQHIFIINANLLPMIPRPSFNYKRHMQFEFKVQSSKSMGSVSCPTCDLERLGSEEVVQVYGFCTHMLYHWIMELCAYGCNSASSGTNPMFIGQSIQEIWLHKVTHAHLNHKTMVKFTYLAIAPILLNGDVTSCEHFQKSGHDSTLRSCTKGVSISPISEA